MPKHTTQPKHHLSKTKGEKQVSHITTGRKVDSCKREGKNGGENNPTYIILYSIKFKKCY